MSLVDIYFTRIVSTSDIKCWKYEENLIYVYSLHYTDFFENHNCSTALHRDFLYLFSLKLVKIIERAGIN